MQNEKITVGVLALQGAFIEHEQMIKSLGANTVELRQKSDLDQKIDAVILPGGESTVQGKLLNELDMMEPLKAMIKAGKPVLATCAGLILLAEHIEEDDHLYFGTLPVTVKRNAYGRQLGSFSQNACIAGVTGGEYLMRFIRAPYIAGSTEQVEVLARDAKNHIVGVRYENQLAFAFHPELTGDTRIHESFLNMV
ncbi:MAG: pyridoxal 5'-phosphate synthase glutaminase subunit PdxT [Lachnospiraceae bacterium]|nr:pyridoxal 5'-phosphate synthase glutaminase subunit PdxT [Lachnospiraceae bacterium]